MLTAPLIHVSFGKPTVAQSQVLSEELPCASQARLHCEKEGTSRLVLPSPDAGFHSHCMWFLGLFSAETFKGHSKTQRELQPARCSLSHRARHWWRWCLCSLSLARAAADVHYECSIPAHHVPILAFSTEGFKAGLACVQQAIVQRDMDHQLGCSTQHPIRRRTPP